MKAIIWGLLLWSFGAETAVWGAPDSGLVAYYNFEEEGAIAIDCSGRGLHAQIRGAALWEKGPFGTALRLNGQDSYVDCGANSAFNIASGGSMAIWIKPQEPLQGGIFSWATGGNWNDERLVLAFNTYHRAPQLIWTMADGTRFISAPLPNPALGVWTHLALTFDGRAVQIYRDGVLESRHGQSLLPKLENVSLQLGRCQGLGQEIFRGLIDEAMIFQRPLSDLEILMLYKKEAARRGKDISAFSKPIISAMPQALTGQLLVDVNFGLMRPLPAKPTMLIRVLRPGATKHLAAKEIQISSTDMPVLSATLEIWPPASPGQLVVTAQICDAQRKRFGETGQTYVEWPPRDPRFSPERGVKILNNLCFELLNVKQPGQRTYTVHNPREGWLFFSLPALEPQAPTIRLDGQPVPLRLVRQNWEAMRYVAAGPHRVFVSGVASRLIVRAIGELFYGMYGANPLVPETGKYTWEWLRQHCLDSYNVVIGPPRADFAEKEIREWTAEGKQWMTQRNLPFDMNVEKVFNYWTSEPGFAHPLMSGIWADEFYGGEQMQKMYPIWCEALHRIYADPRFRGKRFYAFTSYRFIPEYDLLVKTLMACGYRIGAECYWREAPSEAALSELFSPLQERQNRLAWDQAAPEASMNRIYVLGLLSQPEESCDIYPHINYNVFLDRQMRFIATEPAFFGLRGLYGYYSPYVGEEQTRLMAALVRHYALEGKTTPLLSDPYELPHLQNPDFEEGLRGWEIRAAEPGRVAAKTVEGFGWLQGRYTHGVGDFALWTKRSALKPNAISQTIRALQPGRLYSLRFFTGNYQDYLAGTSHPYKHAISVSLENVRLVPEKCFQALIKSNYAHTLGPFNRDNPYRMNYHQIVFVPHSYTACVTFSDWKSPTEPGGPEGEEIIWNFMQLQPYFAEEKAAGTPTKRQ